MEKSCRGDEGLRPVVAAAEVYGGEGPIVGGWYCVLSEGMLVAFEVFRGTSGVWIELSRSSTVGKVAGPLAGEVSMTDVIWC